jgi:hypothetical protein
MGTRRLSMVVLGVLLLGAAPAAAQTTPAPPATPAPAPQAAGAATTTLLGGLPTKRVRYYSAGQAIVVRGRVSPAVAGEVVRLFAVQGRKARRHVHTRVAADGSFHFRLKVHRPGRFRLVVRHAASAAQVAFRARPTTVDVVNWQAGAGERGVKVWLLQRQLLAEGFSTPLTGYYDAATSRAVLAFRKANDLGRDGYATTAVYDKLMRRQGTFKLRYPKAGKHVEFDWSRQVLVLANHGKAFRIFHASSGKPSTPTVFGTFHFYMKTPGTNSHGMVYSSYFIGGYAIHGYADVPAYAASHGCIRVPIPNAVAIYEWIAIGDPIFVYP